MQDHAPTQEQLDQAITRAEAAELDLREQQQHFRDDRRIRVRAGRARVFEMVDRIVRVVETGGRSDPLTLAELKDRLAEMIVGPPDTDRETPREVAADHGHSFLGGVVQCRFCGVHRGGATMARCRSMARDLATASSSNT